MAAELVNVVTECDLLRAEFRRVDVGFVRREHPHAVRLATTYNAKRAAIDPADPATIAAARRALARLMKAVG